MEYDHNFNSDNLSSIDTYQYSKSLNDRTNLPLSRTRIILMNTLWFGLSTLFISLSVVVLPSQIKFLVRDSSKGSTLGIIIAIASLFTLILSPIVGTLSDNFNSGIGKRKPFMCLGMAIMIVCLCGLTVTTPNLHAVSKTEICGLSMDVRRCLRYPSKFDPNNVVLKRNIKSENVIKKNFHYYQISWFALCYLFVVMAHTIIVVPYNGLLADKTPPNLRGFSSGVMGSITLLGNLTGASLGLLVHTIGMTGLYTCLGTINFTCLLVTLSSCSEDPIEGAVATKFPGCSTILWSYIEPLKDLDFRWVFITRLLFQLGVSTITAFLEYWLTDMIPLPYCWSPEKAVAFLLLPLLFSSAVFSIIGGYLSDKLQKRKPLVTALLMSLCTLVLASLRGQYSYIAAVFVAFCIGIGFGAFCAIDFAMVIDVIKNEDHRAKDLAVWHQALILPQCVAAPIGGIILDIFQNVDCQHGIGYIILFSMTSIYFFFGGILVYKIKSIK